MLLTDALGRAVDGFGSVVPPGFSVRWSVGRDMFTLDCGGCKPANPVRLSLLRRRQLKYMIWLVSRHRALFSVTIFFAITKSDDTSSVMCRALPNQR